jgi:peptidoglycan/xylan/chitin deacetylase (PgdA/CDA1 family)
MDRRALSLFVAIGLMLAACGQASRPAAMTAVAPVAVVPAAKTAVTAPARITVTAPSGPYAPNELGEIPILEIHRVAVPASRWQITPDDLRALLANLYASGFRPVDFRAVADRQIDLPRGFAPVVLTFDDGDPSQFQWAPGGQGTTPDPNSAVGILWQFHQTHPDWALAATFFVNRNPFGADSAAKVRWLVAHGFEIGDHTVHHVDMTKLDAAQMLQEVGGMAAWIQNAVPGYRVQTLAYPYGFAAHLPSTAWDGTIDGQSYHIRAAVLVGAQPAPSPYSRQWQPLAVPRIQVADPSTLESKSTLQWVWAGWEPQLLANHGAKLYVSDGNDATVTVPAAERAQLAPNVPAAEIVVPMEAPLAASTAK